MRHKIDPELKLLMHRNVDIPQISLAEVLSKPPVLASQEQERVNILLTFKGDLKFMSDIGFEVGLTAGNVTTGSIPRDRIEALAALDNVLAVDAYRPLRPHLRYSGPDVNADDVHKGKPPSIPGYDGSGVIVGIIDSGIDFRHPAFRHKDQNQSTRILKLRIGEDSFGAAAINQAMSIFDKDDPTYIPADADGHGTHVAGIAAGSDDSLGYLGMAPGADLLIVTNEKTWIEGIDYIATEAAALGKRVVINMSLGSSDKYPCDADPIAQLIHNYLAAHPNLIIVASAGNSGANGHHIEGNISNGECVFQLKVHEKDTYQRIVNLWYDKDESFDLQITSPTGHITSLITPNTNDVFESDLSKPLTRGLELDPSNPLPPPDDVIATAKISGAMTITQPSELCRLMVSLKPGKGAALPPGIWHLKLTGTVKSNPIIHGWVNPDTGGVMTKQALFVGGDGRGTMEVPALVEQVIAVGAYATSTEELGDPGKFSFFSSQGPLYSAFLLPAPTLKPDITAPGQGIISARAKGSQKAPYNFNPQWVVNSGTSMASPHVVGAIALLLQKEPNLTRQQVRDRLLQSGREDNFTGPSLPDYQWGCGKLDVWKLLHPNVPAPAKAENAETLEVSSLGTMDLAGSGTDA